MEGAAETRWRATAMQLVCERAVEVFCTSSKGGCKGSSPVVWVALKATSLERYIVGDVGRVCTFRSVGKKKMFDVHPVLSSSHVMLVVDCGEVRL